MDSESREAELDAEQRRIEKERATLRASKSNRLSTDHSSLLSKFEELNKQASLQRKVRSELFEDVHRLKTELRELESNSASVESQIRDGHAGVEIETLVMQRILLKHMKESRQTLESMILQRERQIQAILGVDEQQKKERERMRAVAERVAHEGDASYAIVPAGEIESGAFSALDNRKRELQLEQEQEQHRAAMELRELNMQRQELMRKQEALRVQKARLATKSVADDVDELLQRDPMPAATSVSEALGVQKASSTVEPLSQVLARVPVGVSVYCSNFVDQILQSMFVRDLTEPQLQAFLSRSASGESLRSISISLGIVIPQEYVPSQVVREYDEAMWLEREKELVRRSEQALMARVLSQLTDVLLFDVYFRSLVSSLLEEERTVHMLIESTVADVLCAETMDFVQHNKADIPAYDGADFPAMFRPLLAHFQKLRTKMSAQGSGTSSGPVCGLRYFDALFCRKLEDSFASGDKRDPLFDKNNPASLDDSSSKELKYHVLSPPVADFSEKVDNSTVQSVELLSSSTFSLPLCASSCAVALSPLESSSRSQRFLAVASLDGFLRVFDLKTNKYPCLFVFRMARGTTVEKIWWALDSMSLVLLDSEKFVHRILLLNSVPKPSEVRMGEDDVESPSSRKPAVDENLIEIEPMRPMYQGGFQYSDIDPLLEERSSWDILDSEDVDPAARKKSKDKKAPEPSPLRFACGAFHSSFTLFFTPTSFLAGLSNGTVVKLNFVPPKSIVCGRPPSEKALQHIRIPESCVKSAVTDVPLFLSLERFRGHRSPLFFVDSVSFSPDILSVDTRGHVFLWKYDRHSLTTFGWFSTEHRFRLPLDRTEFTFAPNSTFQVVRRPLLSRSSSTLNLPGANSGCVEPLQCMASDLLRVFDIEVSSPYVLGEDGSRMFISRDGKNFVRLNVSRQSAEGLLTIASLDVCPASPYRHCATVLNVCASPEKSVFVCLLFDPFAVPKVPQFSLVPLSVESSSGDVLLKPSPFVLPYSCTKSSSVKYVVSGVLPGDDLLVFVLFFADSAATANTLDVFSLQSRRLLQRITLSLPVRSQDVLFLKDYSPQLLSTSPSTIDFQLMICHSLGVVTKPPAPTSFSVLSIRVTLEKEKEVMIYSLNVG